MAVLCQSRKKAGTTESVAGVKTNHRTDRAGLGFPEGFIIWRVKVKNADGDEEQQGKHFGHGEKINCPGAELDAAVVDKAKSDDQQRSNSFYGEHLIEDRMKVGQIRAN